MAAKRRPLRVLLYQFFPGGGIGRYTHELAKALSQEDGINLSVVCSPDFEWLQQATYDVRPILPSLKHPFSLLRRGKFLTAQLQSPRNLLRLAHKESADVLHFSNINHLTFPFWKHLLPPQAVIAATAHDVKRAKAMISRRWEERALKGFYRRADVLFVHSQAQKQELEEWAGCSHSRIQIVPHGIYSYPAPAGDRTWCRKQLGLPEDAMIGLFFGQIRDDKNLGPLIEALADPRVKSHLLVAGSGSARGHRPLAYYKGLVSKLGLEHRVHFAEGYIPEERVGEYFIASDWVSLAYLSSFTSQSGVLNVAMHFRRPVITTPAPTLLQTAQDFLLGTLAKTDAAADLAEAIVSLETAIQTNGVFEFDRYLLSHNWRENASFSQASYCSILYSCKPNASSEYRCR